jgi:hypothetical protein
MAQMDFARVVGEDDIAGTVERNLRALLAILVSPDRTPQK